MSSLSHRPRCADSRDCFGKFKMNKITRCNILDKDTHIKGNFVYEHDGDCPFCKPKSKYTNGQYYPHRDNDPSKARNRYKNKIVK